MSNHQYSEETKRAILHLESLGYIIIDPKREITQKEYTKRTGKKPSTVQNYITRNKIKYRKIKQLNNLVLVQPDTLEAVPYRVK